MAEKEFYDNLRSKALMTAEMILNDEGAIAPLIESLPDSNQNILPFRENFIIYNAQLQRVFAFNRNGTALPEKLLSSLNESTEQRFQHGNLLAISIRHKSKSGRFYLIIAESVFSTEDLEKLRNVLIATFFLFIGVVAGGGWIYAGQAMSPVVRIVSQVEKILPTDLGARLTILNSQDELSRLVITFNGLLDRIQFAFQMQKSFISNVAHELKNPLSVIISQLEIALDKSNRSKSEYRGTLSSILEDTRELNEISEKLLQLAYIHSGGGDIWFEKVRLDETLLQTRSALLRLHPDYHISFGIVGMPEDEEQLCVLANESLLRSAFFNLMDNGCKFSSNKTVAVNIFFDPNGCHRVEFTDQGPGIPEKDLSLIFQPFYRSSQSSYLRGSGIGLSLVESILVLHRIALEVVSKKGNGTTFKLIFPISE